MNSRVFVSAVVVSVVFISSLAVAEPRQQAYTNNVNGVELKMRPSLYAPTITVLPHDTFVIMWGGESDVQQNNGDRGRWVYVLSPRGRGWLFSKDLQADSPTKSRRNERAKRTIILQELDKQNWIARLRRLR